MAAPDPAGEGILTTTFDAAPNTAQIAVTTDAARAGASVGRTFDRLTLQGGKPL